MSQPVGQLAGPQPQLRGGSGQVERTFVSQGGGGDRLRAIRRDTGLPQGLDEVVSVLVHQRPHLRLGQVESKDGIPVG